MTGWTVDAACRAEVRAGRAEVDWWMPDSNHYTRHNLEALWICQACPVAGPCLNDALARSQFDDQVGIYGGTTPRSRRRLRAGEASARVERVRILDHVEKHHRTEHGPPRSHLGVVR